MQKSLNFKIDYNIEIEEIKDRIENRNFGILILESVKFDYNIKTFRIAHELIKKGFKVGGIKFINKKEEYEKNLLNIMLINSITED